MEKLTGASQDSDFDEQPKSKSIAGKLKRFFTPSFSLRNLTTSQWLYFLAFILLLSSIDESFETSDGIYWVGVIAGLGLVRELWHLFHRIWQHMLGKGVILVLYAATANFALAVSALKINAIAGVEPTPFIFTLGFTTLLMLPFWLLAASVLFFSVALLAVNLWLFLSIILRLVRIKVRVHWEDQSLVFFTMFLRLILIPFVLMTLAKVMEPYVAQIKVFDTKSDIISTQGLTEEQLKTIENAPDEDVLSVLSEISNQEVTSNISDIAEGNKELTEEGSEQAEVKNKRYIDTLVATFIYWFETYPYTVCKKEPTQRSFVIDDYSMLLAEKDDSELGYSFSVQACVPRYIKEGEEFDR